MQNIALGIGCLVGAVALMTAIWVWYEKQSFGIGGSVLSAVGIILLGFSIWQSGEVTANKDGFSFKFTSLEEIADVASSIDKNTLSNKSQEKHKGLTLVCPATPAGLAFCTSLGEKLDFEMKKIRVQTKVESVRKIATLPVRLLTLGDEYIILPKSILKKTIVLEDNGEKGKFLNLTSGISASDIKKHGLLGGPNSDVRNISKSLNKIFKF